MSSRRDVILIDDDELSKDDGIGNTAESQIQRLVRQLNEARSTIAYLRVDLTLIQAENARLKAENARLLSNHPHPRDQHQKQLVENTSHGNQPRPSLPANSERHSRNFRDPDQEDHPPKRARTEIQVWVDRHGDLQTDLDEKGQPWEELKAAWVETKNFFDGKSEDWLSSNHLKYCVRNLVQKGSFMRWSVAHPGQVACKTCANTKRICVRYNAQEARLELLPLPTEVRGAFGKEMYLVEEEMVSRKFVGTWE